MFRDYIFVAVVVRDIFRAEHFDRFIERIFEFLNGIIIVIPVESEVRGFYRVKNECVYSVSAFRKKIAESSEIIVELPEFIEPSHMLGIGRGVIPLSLTAYRICGEVLTHKIYAVYILPFGNAFKLLRRNVPTATSESFG